MANSKSAAKTKSKKGRANASPGTVPIPEPDLTPDEIIARAAAMVPMIRDDQAAADERGCHSEEIQQAFVDAGFYRILQPRMFGGYEFDYMTFYRVMLEIARGSPGIGWCLTLGASHAALIAAHWPEQAQIELFGATGHFIAPHRAGIPVEIEHADGGYRVTGKWAYASGCPYSTHFLGNAVIKADNGAEPKPVTFIVPRDAYTILDDWGGDATLGMRASGSNTVVLDDVFVPEHMVVESRPALWSADDLPNGTPGTRLHGNPMYLGRFAGPYHASLVVPVIGAARAALEELKGIAERRTTRFPPFQPWTKNPDVQRPFGEALLLTDTAEALLTRACEMYMEYCRRWDADGTPFTVEDSMRLWGILIKAGRMATEATEIVFDTASSSAAMKGQRLERYYRDIGMYRGHSSSQFQTFAAGIARIHFGDPMGLFGV